MAVVVADPAVPTAAPDDVDPGEPAPSRPAARRRAGWILLALLALGLGLRLVDLDRTPLAFHPARQYRSALIAHAQLLGDSRPADDPERVTAELGVRQLGDLEPTVLERTAAALYHVTGEHLVVPRLLGIAAWLGGAVAAWSILGRRRDLVAQVVGTGALLVLPMGVGASRAFQPDALMVSVSLGAMALALRAEDERRPRLWALALALVAVAAFIKPMGAPMVFAWCAAAFVGSRGLGAVRPRALLAAGAATIPTVAYYVSGAVAGKASGSWLSTSLIPSLYLESGLYRLWWHTVDRAVPVLLVGLAVVAVACGGRRDRLLFGAAGAGYLVMMLLVNYRAATHDYYHLPLMALVCLGLGLGASDLLGRLGRSGLDPVVRRGAMALGAATLVLAAVSLAAGGRAVEPDIGTGATERAANREIGERTGHSRHVLGLTRAYGADLAYEGGVVVVEYPSVADAALLEMRGLPVPTPEEVIADSGAEWFAVTNLGALDDLPDLEAELEHHTLVDSGNGWKLWRLAPD